MQVALLLAKRWVAISWIIPSGPREQGWMKDVKEWAVAEEMHLRQCRRDERAPEDLQTLGLLLTRVEEVPEDEIQESEELLTALGSGTHIRGEGELGGPFQCNAL